MKASLIQQYTLHGLLQTSAGVYYTCDTNCVHPLPGDVNNVDPLPGNVASVHPLPRNVNSVHLLLGNVDSVHPLPGNVNSVHPLPENVDSVDLSWKFSKNFGLEEQNSRKIGPPGPKFSERLGPNSD